MIEALEQQVAAIEELAKCHWIDESQVVRVTLIRGAVGVILYLQNGAALSEVTNGDSDGVRVKVIIAAIEISLIYTG